MSLDDIIARNKRLSIGGKSPPPKPKPVSRVSLPICDYLEDGRGQGGCSYRKCEKGHGGDKGVKPCVSCGPK